MTAWNKLVLVWVTGPIWFAILTLALQWFF